MAGSGQDWEVHQARSCEQEQWRREHVLSTQGPFCISLLGSTAPSSGHLGSSAVDTSLLGSLGTMSRGDQRRVCEPGGGDGATLWLHC